MNDWNAAVVEEFRSNGGRVEQFGDAPLVILNTIGAKTGQVREIPLVTLQTDDRIFVFASAAGAPKHPDWYHNLLANPEIDVEIGTEKFRAELAPLDEAASAERLGQQAALMPQFGEYVTSAAPRLIPAFEIRRR
ncbi:MAG: nitroreductase/quinone reductase family protein [Acidimicrobiales bacterium]